MSDRTQSTESSLRQQAEQRMRQKDFAAAIGLLERHLEQDRNDMRALLELGISHLLNGAEEPFRKIHEQASGLVSQARELPADVVRLWEHYHGLFIKISSTALVMGTMAAAGGCGTTVEPAKTKPTATQGTGTSAVPVTPPLSSSHRYSGGVYIKPQVDTQPTQPATRPVPPTSSHKYSGGVYIQPDVKN